MKKASILIVAVILSLLTGVLAFSAEIKNLYYINETGKINKLGDLNGE